MRVTVIGAGAIGGTTGAYLARAGHEVLLVDAAADHVQAINREGLAIEGYEELRARIPAVTPEALPAALGGRPLETVLFAVKAQATARAIETVAPLLADDGYVVSLQNGLNERVIAARVGAERTIGAFINFGADYQTPGRIMYGNPGALYLGELDGRITPRLERLGTMFREAFLEDTQLTDNIWGYLWGKVGYSSLLYATATVDETIADVFADLANRPFLANLAGEAIAVADAEGVRPEGFDGYDPDAMRFATPRRWQAIHESFDRLVAFNRASLKQKSGNWRDLAVRRRRTDVDYTAGQVSEIARGHGLRVPVCDRLVALIHEIEDGRPMARANIEELRRVSAAAYPE